ncbi:uncharacterized protein LOC127251429 [Andrographis paniculata]|uniref:uncharacterized protein LOC127251429 n=1 Tax=Andrographis paniculata TaxID=175694 RepID=UPI0021E8FD27|nr:uncharacterized protein LOC127251429 [Andrographis paniculata]
MDVHRHRRIQGRSPKSDGQKETSKKSSNNALKVKYISSPMRVKTSPSRFRSIVQKLTGKNSDAERCIAAADYDDRFHEVTDDFIGTPYAETMERHGRDGFYPVGVFSSTLPPTEVSPGMYYPYQMEFLQSYDQHMQNL